jgi:hypothetical protein
VHAAVEPGSPAATENALKDKDCDIALEIQRIKDADMDSLCRVWRAGSRKPFPDHLPRYLIVSLVAWQLQASRMGGLLKEEEKYLAGIASKSADTPIDRYGKQKGSHQVGTVFVREHDGIAHRVVKIESGFEWQGRQYNSLSAVASAITGTNWNGLRFFGVLTSKEKSRGRH